MHYHIGTELHSSDADGCILEEGLPPIVCGEFVD